MRRGKVVVVDDDPIALRILCARLEGAGYTVIPRIEPLGTSQVIADEQPDVELQLWLGKVLDDRQRIPHDGRAVDQAGHLAARREVAERGRAVSEP